MDAGAIIAAAVHHGPPARGEGGATAGIALIAAS